MIWILLFKPIRATTGLLPEADLVELDAQEPQQAEGGAPEIDMLPVEDFAAAMLVAVEEAGDGVDLSTAKIGRACGCGGI